MSLDRNHTHYIATLTFERRSTYLGHRTFPKLKKKKKTKKKQKKTNFPFQPNMASTGGSCLTQVHINSRTFKNSNPRLNYWIVDTTNFQSFHCNFGPRHQPPPPANSHQCFPRSCHQSYITDTDPAVHLTCLCKRQYNNLH